MAAYRPPESLLLLLLLSRSFVGVGLFFWSYDGQALSLFCWCWGSFNWLITTEGLSLSRALSPLLFSPLGLAKEAHRDP